MILVVGTRGRGGILSVIEAIAASDLARRWPLVFVPSHDSGSMLRRVGLAAAAGLRVVWLGLTRPVTLMHLHSAMRGSFWRKSIYMTLGWTVGVPSVLHLHGSEMKVFYDQQGRVGRWLIQRTLHSADRVVVLSESWRRFVLGVAPRARVELVFNFVQIPAELSPQPRQPDEPFRLAFLGLIGDRKGIFDLVQAVARLLAQRPGSLQLLVGGNGEVARLERAVAEAGLGGHVQILGWIDAQARIALLKSVHALALPSYNEGLPMALLEAMSYALPVLSTHVGGIPELVDDGRTGYLIEPGDTAAMVDRLGCWLDDDGARIQMGQAARERVERDFSVQHAVQRLDAVYAAVANRRRHGGQT